MKETSYQLVAKGQKEGGKDEWGEGRERVWRGTGRGGERDGGPGRGQVPFSGVCVCRIWFYFKINFLL